MPEKVTIYQKIKRNKKISVYRPAFHKNFILHKRWDIFLTPFNLDQMNLAPLASR